MTNLISHQRGGVLLRSSPAQPVSSSPAQAIRGARSVKEENWVHMHTHMDNGER
jgi:hypothetical protein